MANNAEERKKKKLSYDELENVAKQLSDQAKRMHAQIQQQQAELVAMSNNMAVDELNILFRVIENKEHFYNKDFVDVEKGVSFISSITNRIMDMLTPKKDVEDKEGK